jgi:Tfp pilus assembly protein PilN
MKRVRLELDFASQRPQVAPVARALLAGALLLLALAGLQLGFKLADNARQSDLIALANAATSAAKPNPRVLPSSPTERARTQRVRQAAQRLATPWADLLAAIEAAPANVALLQLDPSATQHSLSLSAEAADPAQMLNYLQALQSDPRLRNVVLVSHQVQLQAPGTPLRFKLRAQWGDAP